jgi:hypothetical protein
MLLCANFKLIWFFADGRNAATGPLFWRCGNEPTAMMPFI